MRSGKYNAPLRRKKATLSLRRIALASALMFVGATALAFHFRPASAVAQMTTSDRLQTPGMDLADENTRKALRRLQAPHAHYRGQWLGDACIDGGADSPEIYVLSRYRMSSHGPEAAVRVTVNIDVGGHVVHESLDTSTAQRAAGRKTRSFDVNEARELRQLLVDGGYLTLANGSDRTCIGDAITLQSCVNGRYFGRVSHCEEPSRTSLPRLSDAIEAFALGEQAAPR